MADVKAEIKPEIKIDPATEGRSLHDIEEFEDDIDLSFPEENSQAWLVRVPEDLWKSWADIYKESPDDSPVEIGKMRVYNPPPGEDADMTKQRIQIRLHPNVPQHIDISKQYDVVVNTREYNNSVVFSEKDMPGHKPQPFGRNRLQPNRPTGIPSRDQRYGRDGKARSRSAIPKQTTLAPKVQHEATATPVLDADYDIDFQRKWAAHMAPKSRTTFVESVDRNLANPTGSRLNNFNTFGISSRPGAGKGKKGSGVGARAPKDKAVRMEKGDLLDALQKCFRRYKYWPMKSLRNELRQPEAWIKEVLEEIAVLIRSGDFALNWTLRPEWQKIVDEGQSGNMGMAGGQGAPKQEEAVAKIESGTEGTGDEMAGDEDDEEFENVDM